MNVDTSLRWSSGVALSLSDLLGRRRRPRRVTSCGELRARQLDLGGDPQLGVALHLRGLRGGGLEDARLVGSRRPCECRRRAP